MNALKQKRGNAKACLTRAVDFVASIDSDTTIQMLEIRLSRVVEAWSEFVSLHNEFIGQADESEVGEFEVEFGSYEDKYFVAHSGLKKAIQERQSAIQSQSQEPEVLKRFVSQQENFLKRLDSSKSTCSSINLPKIVVPPFSGNYKDWPSFKDLFVGSVDSKPDLTATQKFHYLKSFLREDAANLIKHISISEANYVEAWDRLERRYDRVNLIVQSFVQTFLTLPSLSTPNVQSLRRITDGADEVIRGLHALNKTGRDPWLIFLLLAKLDTETKQAWAEEVGSRDDSSISDLIEFLELRCDALEACQTLNRSVASRSKQSNQIRTHHAKSSSNNQCPVCKSDHLLSQCPQFLSSDINSRRKIVKAQSACFNCLRIGHSANKCRSCFRCRVCKSRHHTLVHQDDSTNISVSVPSTSNSDTPPSLTQNYSQCSSSTPHTAPPLVSNHSLEPSIRKQTILPTILAKVQDNRGQFVDCRILLDTGSQSSFVTESFVQRIGLPRKHARISVTGLSSLEAGHTKGCVSIQIHSRVNSTQLSVDAFILGKLTSKLPSKSFVASTWEHFSKLILADPLFNISNSVDMLLGADKVWNILEAEQLRGPEGTPIAQNTSFGWVISGELSDPNHRGLSSFVSAIDVDILLQRFWELEEIACIKANSSFIDAAEEQFRKTVSRSPDGKYIVALPFKTISPRFGNTLHTAVSRLNSMEHRFRNNQELQQEYSRFMKEYLDLGHMSLIPCHEIYQDPSQQFYLPHHAVLKPDSSSTKLRVVFDGSTKDSNGISLNSQLLIGPPIQRDLIGVCLRFRQHRYVFTADIVKMFRQIWVRDSDTNYQRIVWRESAKDSIRHYRLKTVTYGTASAPFLSVRVLQQIAEDYEAKYPKAAKILLNDVYVDDIMTGASTIQTLIDLQSEIVALLSLANLQLRKWSSNCWALLAKQLPEDCEYSFFDPERSQSLVKVLGMFWNPHSDIFSYRLNSNHLKSYASVTRRTMLSEIASIFDPLGLLAPSVVLFKMLFQELWSSELKLGWDDPLPIALCEKWSSYRQQLLCFEEIKVPRHIFQSGDDIELHGFSDASTLAYAAVVYARSKSPQGNITTTIIAAKTKVAPLKPVSIPRLELCGALLLSRLLSLVKSSVTANIGRTVAWCDSEIVLHWLSSNPRRWTTFVANRSASILEKIPRYSWRYVPTASNPADCASRGVLPSRLPAHCLWWSGPSWLSLPEEHWPESKIQLDISNSKSVSQEERPTPKQVLVTFLNGSVLEGLLKRISSWYKLQRIVASCIRFVNNCKTDSSNRNIHGLTYSEIRSAKIIILKMIQLGAFESDIQNLRTRHQISPKSKLLKYSAFLDEDGLLRVGGRIKNAHVSFSIKHPIILPKNSPICSLIVSDIHQRYLHAGVSETFAFVRQEFWIMGSRNLIRKTIHQCKQCFMQRKQTSQQIMGDLPSHRIQQSRPFSNTGCDYAGPFLIKLSRCRKAKMSKAYIALFICMSTKAIHLELVSDLTTDAFIAALRRFVSRRGKCSNIFSDNGTNFQGARRCLTEMHKLVLKQTHNNTIGAALAKDGISWHFIPPSAPHFGGLWEAGVKSVKLHLRRVIGNSILTFEEFCTLLCQVEAVLNSRPLCSMSDTDLNPLTPGHFLVGEPLTAVPEPSHLELPTNRLSRWNHIQNMIQGFWKRWHMEYLTTLQERPKWQQPTINIKPGDLVVIKEPNLPPTKWLLGRIEAVNEGPDQRVRVATIRTSGGTFVRPITKLAALPMS